MKLGAAEYKAKFGKAPGCPDTMAEWEQMAKFFHTKKGQTRWGKKFDKPLYGAQAYRSINFSYRQFPAYMGGLLFDKDMNPTINSPNGIRAIKEFTSIVKYMPPDVQGWGTPQLYPHWGKWTGFLLHVLPLGDGLRQPQLEEQDQRPSVGLPGSRRERRERQNGSPRSPGGQAPAT